MKGSKKHRKEEFTVYMAEDFSGIAAIMILQHGQADESFGGTGGINVVWGEWMCKSSLWRGFIAIPTA